jgi:hypothetical protein
MPLLVGIEETSEQSDGARGQRWSVNSGDENFGGIVASNLGGLLRVYGGAVVIG